MTALNGARRARDGRGAVLERVGKRPEPARRDQEQSTWL
jgi:hypothetical protein